MKTLKRKTRSDKFPLTLHPTGQYCKKIKGKIYYFSSDKKEALQKYLDQAAYLHGCPYASVQFLGLLLAVYTRLEQMEQE
jgi:YHS domain-containing protein